MQRVSASRATYTELGQLGPYTDFELGALSDKMSARRWVLGSEWDFLATWLSLDPGAIRRSFGRCSGHRCVRGSMCFAPGRFEMGRELVRMRRCSRGDTHCSLVLGRLQCILTRRCSEMSVEA